MNPPAANPNQNMMFIGQMQMINAITQQSQLFQGMNALLKQLNDGFRALTKAIMENTKILAGTSMSPALSRAYAMSKAPGAGPMNIAPHGGLKQPMIDSFLTLITYVDAMSASIEGIVGSGYQLAAVQKQQVAVAQNALGMKQRNQTLFQDPSAQLKNMFGVTGTRAAYQSTKAGVQSGFGGGGGLLGAISGIGSAFSTFRGNNPIKGGLGKQAGNMAAPFMGALSTMGPQFAMMAIVMAPVQALLEGLFEPFEMITDIFGAYGSILGQMFLPILQAFQPILLSFLPILSAIAPLFGQLIMLVFQFMTPLGLLMPLITALMTYITPIITGISGFITDLMVGLNALNPLQLLMNLFAGLGPLLNDAWNNVTGAWNNIGRFFTETIPNSFWTMVNSIGKIFQDIGVWIKQVMDDLWAEIKSLGATKTKTFG